MSLKLFIFLITCLLVCSSTTLENYRNKRQIIGGQEKQPDIKPKDSKNDADQIVHLPDNDHTPKQIEAANSDHTVEKETTLKNSDVNNKKDNGTHGKKENSGQSKQTNSGNNSLNSTKAVGPPHIDVDAGTMKRGLLVFVGIGLIFIFYLGIKMYRSNLSSNKNVMVKKYGVRARRTDMEMTLLPLEEEDEDDETVFDLENIKTNTT